MKHHNSFYNFKDVTIRSVENGFIVIYQDYAYKSLQNVYKTFEEAVSHAANQFGLLEIGEIVTVKGSKDV